MPGAPLIKLFFHYAFDGYIFSLCRSPCLASCCNCFPTSTSLLRRGHRLTFLPWGNMGPSHIPHCSNPATMCVWELLSILRHRSRGDSVDVEVRWQGCVTTWWIPLDRFTDYGRNEEATSAVTAYAARNNLLGRHEWRSLQRPSALPARGRKSTEVLSPRTPLRP